MSFRPRTAASIVLVLAASTVGCGGEAPNPYEPLPPRDLDMLELMLAMNPPYLGMQPHLRDESKLGALAAAADLIGDLAEDPRMTGYTARPDFQRDPEPYERFRLDLLESSRAAAEAARVGAFDQLHRAHALMSASCVACHKRYSPHQ